MFGIPTLITDYSNDSSIFDPKHDFKADPSFSREKNLYWLQKAMIGAYRQAGLPVKVAKEVAVRNASQILDSLLNPLEEEPVAEVESAISE